jgi:Flp pilus assembly protein CpaB
MSKPRVRTSALIASAVAIAAAGVLAACGGGARTHAGTAAPNGRPQPGRQVVVTISSRRSGHSLPAAFVGLAMEDWALTKNQFAHTNLRRYW